MQIDTFFLGTLGGAGYFVDFRDVPKYTDGIKLKSALTGEGKPRYTIPHV